MTVLKRGNRLAARHSTLGDEHGDKPNQNKTEGLLDKGRGIEGQTKVIFIRIFPYSL